MDINRRHFEVACSVFLQVILNQCTVSRSRPALVKDKVAEAVENDGSVIHFNRFQYVRVMADDDISSASDMALASWR